MMFIKLTEISYIINEQFIKEDIPSELYVNPFHIGNFIKYDRFKYTFLDLRNNRKFEVKETSEEILKLIESVEK